MTKRMTAEEVAAELDRRAESESGDEGCWNVAVAHGDAAKLVRESLIESEDQRRERFERWFACEFEYASTQVKSVMLRAWQAALTYRDSEES